MIKLDHKQTREKIKELYALKKTKQEIQDELGVNRRTVNVALCYTIRMEREALQPKVKESQRQAIIEPVGLYAERDAQMMRFYDSLNTKGALSMLKIEVKSVGNMKGRNHA